MSTVIDFHGVRHFKAASTPAKTSNRGNGWVEITLRDRTGHEQEVNIFCDDFVLAGRIAKAINEAQHAHTQARVAEARAKTVDFIEQKEGE